MKYIYPFFMIAGFVIWQTPATMTEATLIRVALGILILLQATKHTADAWTAKP